MIDLISTRNVDHQTRGCARLLAAVIAQAVKDASSPMSSYASHEGRMIHEKNVKRNLNWDARSAIRWLFFPGSVFPAYAMLIGLDANQIRSNLLSHRHEQNAMLTSEQRRIIRTRLDFEKGDDSPAERVQNADESEL